MYETLELITLALIPGFILFDLVYQARKYDKARFWRLRATVVTIAIFFFSAEVVAGWGIVFGDYHLIDSSVLGTAGSAIVGIVVYEFLHYWYHRLAHEWNWLWRAGHQMHHSAESLDAFGAYYQHPIDALFFATIVSVVFMPLLGMTVEASIIAALFLTFNAMFQHANIRTPHWLGYLIQRPESHHIHHGKGIHRLNYSDLPLWDIIFGTFRNPTAAEIENLECGFYRGASARIPEMLIGRYVDKPDDSIVTISKADVHEQLEIKGA